MLKPVDTINGLLPMASFTEEGGEDLRYPIGRFQIPPQVSATHRNEWIGTIESLPVELSAALSGLGDEELSTPYRHGGWTVRQLVHHLADSHINAYVRMRLALTEETPVIKTYQEAKWAELPDAQSEDPAVSLQLLEALHRRWTFLLEKMTGEQFARKYRHPEFGEMDMAVVLALYAWHCRHHLAHVASLRKRSGWNDVRV